MIQHLQPGCVSHVNLSSVSRRSGRYTGSQTKHTLPVYIALYCNLQGSTRKSAVDIFTQRSLQIFFLDATSKASLPPSRGSCRIFSFLLNSTESYPVLHTSACLSSFAPNMRSCGLTHHLTCALSFYKSAPPTIAALRSRCLQRRLTLRL